MTMLPEVKKTVRNTCIFSASVAVVLSPVPLADELVLLPTYGIMAAKIAKHHSLAARSLPWKHVVKTTAGALAARAAVNLSVAYLPGVAAVANATSAVALTTLLGSYVDALCTDPTAPRALSVREIVERFKARARPAASAPST